MNTSKHNWMWYLSGYVNKLSTNMAQPAKIIKKIKQAIIINELPF